MGAIERATNENVIANADRETLAGWVEELRAENARLRSIIDTLTAKAPATASLAVFLCSKCRESVDTVYEVGSGANVEHVCVKCVQN